MEWSEPSRHSAHLVVKNTRRHLQHSDSLCRTHNNIPLSSPCSLHVQRTCLRLWIWRDFVVSCLPQLHWQYSWPAVRPVHFRILSGYSAVTQWPKHMQRYGLKNMPIHCHSHNSEYTLLNLSSQSQSAIKVTKGPCQCCLCRLSHRQFVFRSQVLGLSW